MIQLCPARAKKTTVEPIEGFLAEQKIDGQRYIVHTNPVCNCTSRRLSVVTQEYVAKGDRVPHLTRTSFPDHSLLDCEFVSPADIVPVELPGHLWDQLPDHPHHDFIKRLGYLPVYPHVSSTTSIMGSEANEAIRKQEEVGKVWAYCFDILQFKGQGTMRSTQGARRKFLENQLRLIEPEQGIVLMPQWPSLSADDQQLLFDLITAPGGEGIILKDPEKAYNAASNWYKWKKDFPVDAVLTGNYTWGKGKLSDRLGALEIGVYKDNHLYPVGNISAIMDSETKLYDLTADRDNLAGRVVECRHNGKQSKKTAPLGFTLRHPRFRRWRDEEKNPEDCTVEALLNELSVGK